MSGAQSRRQDTRRRHVPVETSWRIVDGDHESFDTSVLPDEMLDDDDFNTSSSAGPPSQHLSNLSQLSSQSRDGGDWRIGGSQDNSTVQDFISRADDDDVIIRSPFRPSLPTAAVRPSPRQRQDSNNNNSAADRSPDPQFYMPRVDVDSPRRPSFSTASSSRTVRPAAQQKNNLRQRAAAGHSPNNTPPESLFASKPHHRGAQPQRQDTDPGMASTFLSTLHSILAWSFGLVGMTARYAQKPLAVGLALYLTLGMLIFAGNWARHTFYTALSPICNLPGLTAVVDLPFCQTAPEGARPPGPWGSSSPPNVEFDGLMDIQERLEDVAEKSANGVSLPLQMKRSETSIRDLSTLVGYSQLTNKEVLVDLFKEYMTTARTASGDLQKFNVHVGSAVDNVIAINRWTSRYLDGLVAEQAEAKGLLADVAAWLFAPFQPPSFSEARLLDTYIEHAGKVSDKIAQLIVEAQGVLRTLERTDDSLSAIHDFVVRTHDAVRLQKDDTLWTLWTLLGANRKRVHNLDAQLRLLRVVGTQRGDAVRLVVELKEDLERIQLQLDDLRQRVAEPELAVVAGSPPGVASGGGGVGVPLGAHIDRINMGVERLEAARSRIRAIENDRIREVLARGKEEERMIEAS